MMKSSVLRPHFLGVLLTTLVASTLAKQVCYGKYGCFSNDPPFNRSLIPLPQSPKEVGTTYYLITKSDPSGTNTINDYDVTLLKASGYDGSKKTVVIVHGWREDPQSSKWINDMKKELISKEDVNVIVAGWKKGAQKFSTMPVANTRLVGAQITVLIRFLNQHTGNSPASFHVIGFSLGGQIAGYVGRRLQKVKLGRITGLDPAGLFFTNVHTDVRLDPSDATFVDVIHTNAPFGTMTKSGHLDFWPNGGMLQRGCGVGKVGLFAALVCHHYRAPNFYVDSLESQCPFRSYRCSSWDQFTRGNCMSCGHNGCPEMGHNATHYKGLANGSFYLYTNEDKPYCVHRYVFVTFKTSSNWLADGSNPRIRIHGTKGSTEKIKLKSRYLAKGSTEKFVAPIKMDLGTLTSIDVWHFNLFRPFNGWKLDNVTVEYTDTHERYRACFGKWLYMIPKNRQLVKGDGSC